MTKIADMLSDIPGVPRTESVLQKSRILAEMLRAEGHDVSEHGVRKWFIHGSIPSKWLTRVTAMARKSAPKFDPFTYI